MKENLIEKTLKERVKERDAVFVFPTQIAASLWADRIIEISDCTAVAMDRFIAWDKFKGEAVRGENQDRVSIPATMRSIFAAQLIEENAKSSFLKNLVVPEYAKSAAGFASWLGSIFPGLRLWKDNVKQIEDDEDRDLEILYEKYTAFLDKYNLFDPAWERPPFKNNGKKYFLFFPEILSDWEEYKSILSAAKGFINIISLPEEDADGEVLFFSNSRIEIKNVASEIRKLHDEKKLEWSKIAVSVPNLDRDGAYIDREFDLMEIPHAVKYSKPLGSTGAGNLFALIKECLSTNFSYESVKNLLLEDNLPWIEKELAEELVAFGQNNHCICSFEYKGKFIDVWKESMKVQQMDEMLKKFYLLFNSSLEKFKNAETFAQLREAYFNFRNIFLNMDECSDKTNSILSRCISELGEIIDIENSFEECRVPSPLNFFVDYLSEKNYLGQITENGVQVLPYKTAAAAPFDCHLIVDASQSSLNITYKELSFLNDEKRFRILKREESNVSEKYIKLYLMNSIKENAHFTCSKRTLDDYAQATSYLCEVPAVSKEEEKERYFNEEKYFPGNPYNSEKKWLMGDTEEFPAVISRTEKTSFENWMKIQKAEGHVQEKAAAVIAGLNEEKPVISCSQMKSFYKCPRNWLLSSRLNIEEQDEAAELINQYTSGNLYHKIIELFCEKIKKKGLYLKIEEEGLSSQFKSFLTESIDEAIEYRDRNFCYLKKELLNTTKDAITKTAFRFVTKFCTVFNNCEVISSEGWYKKEYENYVLNGRIDCLLRDKENLQYYLVDFKNTGRAIPSNLYAEEKEADESEENMAVVTDPDSLPLEEQNLPDFQMAVYIKLIEDSNDKVKIENGAFFDISGAECKPVFGKSLALRLKIDDGIKNYDDYQKTVDKVFEAADNFVKRIKAGDYSINPAVQNYSYCSGCVNNSICRKTFNVGKK